MISAGFAGGMQIANGLMARYWISAHDEDKHVGGVGTWTVKTRKFDRDEADKLGLGLGGKHKTEMMVLDTGGEMVIDSGGGGGGGSYEARKE